MFVAVRDEEQEVTECCIVRSVIICLVWEMSLGSSDPENVKIEKHCTVNRKVSII